MHARELKGGEARSKEHVVSVEVSVRGGHSALGSASHPGRAVPLAGTAWEKISPAWEQRMGRKQAEALPWPRRKSKGKGSQGGGWGRRAGSMEKGFSGQRNSPPSRLRVSSWHGESTERSKIPLSVIRNVLNQ